MLFALPLLATSALAGVIQIRQSTDNQTAMVINHAISSTLDLGITGYANFVWPVPRGYAKTSHREFCGGFPEVPYKNIFPLQGGKISLIQNKDITNVWLAYSTVPSPTDYSQFTPLVSNYTELDYGLSCTATPDLAAMGLTAGQNITIALQYTYGAHQFQYNSCSDVTIVEAAAWDKEIICLNAMLPQATAEMISNGTSDAFFGLEADSGLSAAAGGGIGAGVTLAVIGLVLAALAFLGLLSFGKKRQPAYPGVHHVNSNDSGSQLAEKHV